MAVVKRQGALALIGGGLLIATVGLVFIDHAQADEQPVKRRVVQDHAPRARTMRTAQARPLTIRRRPVVPPVDVVGGPGFADAYVVRQHGWDDPSLYYFGPFRTGGQTFYGDQAGSPITRGNAGLGQVAGYGGAGGGFGGPHFDSVGGFHSGPGPDAKIDADYASGSLSRPDYDFAPHYAGVKERVTLLDTGVVPRDDGVTTGDRNSGRRMVAEGRSTNVSFEEAKARFAAPMARQAPVEAGFANGGVNSIELGDDAF